MVSSALFLFIQREKKCQKEKLVREYGNGIEQHISNKNLGPFSCEKGSHVFVHDTTAHPLRAMRRYQSILAKSVSGEKLGMGRRMRSV